MKKSPSNKKLKFINGELVEVEDTTLFTKHNRQWSLEKILVPLAAAIITALATLFATDNIHVVQTNGGIAIVLGHLEPSQIMPPTSTVVSTSVPTSIPPSMTIPASPSQVPTAGIIPTLSPSAIPSPTSTLLVPIEFNWKQGQLLQIKNPEGVWLRQLPNSNAQPNATGISIETYLVVENDINGNFVQFDSNTNQWWWHTRLLDHSKSGWVEQNSVKDDPSVLVFSTKGILAYQSDTRQSLEAGSVLEGTVEYAKGISNRNSSWILITLRNNREGWVNLLDNTMEIVGNINTLPLSQPPFVIIPNTPTQEIITLTPTIISNTGSTISIIPNATPTIDDVFFISASPPSHTFLTNGQTYSFSVRVGYSLATQPQAALTIKVINGSILGGETAVPVEKGAGNSTFNLTIRAQSGDTNTLLFIACLETSKTLVCKWSNQDVSYGIF